MFPFHITKGQGVYTITSPNELQDFLDIDHHYDKFIVQSLVGNASWSSTTRAGKFYHVGTIPNKKNNTFVSDLRMMVTGNKDGFRPICIYGRKSRLPLAQKLDPSGEFLVSDTFFFKWQSKGKSRWKGYLREYSAQKNSSIS